MPPAGLADPAQPIRVAVQRAKLWAVKRSPSLVGLLYLPAPERPILSPRPRLPPTALRRIDPEGLLIGEVTVRGEILRIDPPIAWHPADLGSTASELHRGEEVLALMRLGRDRSDTEAERLGRRILADWMEHNPVASEPGWEGTRLSRRLACWATLAAAAADSLPPEEQTELLRGLHLQARFLAANLVRHDPGVLLLGELRALLGAASVLSGSEPRRWWVRAAGLLPATLAVQILPDGGHASRDTSLHLRALSDALDVLALLPPESPASRSIRDRLPRMLNFARTMSHPDGQMSGFGGREAGLVPDLADLIAAAPGLGAGVPTPHATFPDSGFTALHDPAAGFACLVDWRGPDGNDDDGAPGSFEASFGGVRLVASPVSGPEVPTARTHNSVSIDGRPLRRGASSRETVWGDGPGLSYLGLRVRLGALVHHRRLLALDSRAVVVVDHVSDAERSVESWLQLDAGTHIHEAGTRRIYLERAGQTVTLAWMPGAEIGAAPGWVRGHDGALVKSTALRLWAPGGGPRLIGYVLAEGRRRDAGIDVVERDGERIGVLFDPRRYLVRWDPGALPRVLLAD